MIDCCWPEITEQRFSPHLESRITFGCNFGAGLCSLSALGVVVVVLTEKVQKDC